MVGREAMSDGGDRLTDDEIPETLAPVLAIFFEEVWPVLRASTEALSAFVESDEHVVGDGLPRKTFSVTLGFGKFRHGKGL